MELIIRFRIEARRSAAGVALVLSVAGLLGCAPSKAPAGTVSRQPLVSESSGFAAPTRTPSTSRSSAPAATRTPPALATVNPGSTLSPTTNAEPTSTSGANDGYPFGAHSFWRTSITDAPLDPRSQARADHLAGTVADRYGGVAAFNAHQYNSPVYTVTARTPRVRMGFSDCQGKSAVPTGLFGKDGQFEAVPVPATAVPAAGTDASITFYSPSTDQLWEFWQAAKAADGSWSACWGGRIDQASTGPGYFSGGFGATATGLPNAGGQVRISEIRRGRIEHAMSLAVPAPADASDFSWPAQRSDGFDPNPSAMPEGSRLRLDPSLDLSTLGLTPAGLTIARAAQRYGFVVVDKSGAVSVIAQAEPAVSGDPWRAVLGGPDYAVLKNFPWNRLQVIQKDYGKDAR